MNRTAVTRSMAAIAASVLAWSLAVGAPADALTDGTFLDRFATVSFAGDDGNLPWHGPWEEVRETDGVGDGAVRVKGGIGCVSGFCLEIGTFPGSGGIGVQRSADLTGSDSATLAFSYRRVAKAGGGAIVLLVSRTGSAPWTRLASYPFAQSDGAHVEAAIPIDDHIGPATTIRWVIVGDGVRSRFGIDNVSIVVAGGSSPPSTATSTPAATTTTEASTPATTAKSEHAATNATTTTSPVSPTTTAPTTTTTTAPGAIAAPESPSSSQEELPGSAASGRPSGSRPTEGLALAGEAPGPADTAARYDGPTFTATPLTRMTAAFATGVETLSDPPIAIAILAIVVAWLSVKGLERSPRQSARALEGLRRIRRR